MQTGGGRGWKHDGGMSGYNMSLGEEHGGGCTYVVHGRSCIPGIYNHRPSHPLNAGTEQIGFSPTRQTFDCSDKARSAARCCASRLKGELHPLVKVTCEAESLALGDCVERI